MRAHTARVEEELGDIFNRKTTLDKEMHHAMYRIRELKRFVTPNDARQTAYMSIASPLVVSPRSTGPDFQRRTMRYHTEENVMKSTPQLSQYSARNRVLGHLPVPRKNPLPQFLKPNPKSGWLKKGTGHIVHGYMTLPSKSINGPP